MNSSVPRTTSMLSAASASVLTLLLLLACSKKEDKSSPGVSAAQPAQTAETPPITDTTLSMDGHEESDKHIQRPAWDEELALKLLFAPDTVPVTLSRVFEAELLSVNSSEPDSIGVLNAFVQFVKVDTSPEEEMYHQWCPTIAVYSGGDNDEFVLVSSLALDCYTNYDDSFVSLELEQMRVGHVDLVKLSAEGSGGSSEEYSSETNVYLYALIDGELSAVLQVKTGARYSSEQQGSENYDRNWVLAVGEETSHGLPHLVLSPHAFAEHETMPKGDEVILYRWNGTSFEQK